LIEILAHPKYYPQTSVGEIFLKDIILDPGKEEKTQSFHLVNTFGKLQIYEPFNFNSPPEFGSLSALDQVKDIVTLFEEADKQKDKIDKKGFIVLSQNMQKNLQELPRDAILQAVKKDKISDSRYWLKLNEATGSAFLILSKTFNSEWKVVSGVSKDELTGGFFKNLNLLKKSVLPEDQHFVVNGYANLWKVNGEETQFAIIFMPQIFADIGWKVSIFSIILLGGVTLVWVLKKYTFLR
ncbi:MAG: hypothetical protein Q8Q91_00530, partial [Candidatus Daviesbacteria bacterium]|nr:hypothetical protein [Candidatus Daviesbacteria bacterium]